MDSKVFPDLTWQLPDRWVVVEIDEDSHTDRASSCELRRISDLTEAVHRTMGEIVPVLIVRFNPDAWDGGRASLEERTEALARCVHRLLTEELGEYTQPIPYVWYMYYHSKGQSHIDAAHAAAPNVCVVST